MLEVKFVWQELNGGNGFKRHEIGVIRQGEDLPVSIDGDGVGRKLNAFSQLILLYGEYIVAGGSQCEVVEMTVINVEVDKLRGGFGDLTNAKVVTCLIDEL